MKFLQSQGSLSPSDVDLLWKCQQGKHEEDVRVVFGLINEVSSELSVSLLDQLFAKAETRAGEQIDDLFMNFLKEFTQSALQVAEQALMRTWSQEMQNSD